jgi:hypothetical protein
MKADSQDFIAIATLVVDAMIPLCASQKNWRRRVAYRVQAGGHPVAANTIRERYHRLWALIAEAIARCDQATVYDNSGIKGPDERRFHRRLARVAALGAVCVAVALADRVICHTMYKPTDYRSASLAAIWPTMATAAGRVWL